MGRKAEVHKSFQALFDVAHVPRLLSCSDYMSVSVDTEANTSLRPRWMMAYILPN